MLMIKGLNKSFSQNQVLKDVDLSVKKGEVVCIIGPSGSGKSTLLRCINYLEKPSSGTIVFEGKTIQDTPGEIRRLRRDVGMVFQEFYLFEMKNVLHNLTLAPILTRRLDRQQAIKEAKKNLEFVGLTDKIYAMPNTLSGGQKQRVAIARALTMQPKLLLLDEPTSALDPELVQEVLKVIRSLAKRETTMIIVTHQIEFAKEIADRIIFMEDGRIIEEGSPDELFNNPKEERTKQFIKSAL